MDEIISDILISSSNGFKTPIILLTKLIYPLWNCQSAQMMLFNITVLFCWLIRWKCCEKMKIGTFDRLFHPSNYIFKRCYSSTPFFSSFAYVWLKWSIFLHKTTWQFYCWKNKCSPLFWMTLPDSDTLLCLIKLINCLMDHKSANANWGLLFYADSSVSI